MNAERLKRIRERQAEHSAQLESATWFTPAQLAARWNVSQTTIYMIPVKDLPYKTFGKGDHPRRRYSPAAVAAFEAPESQQASA